MSRRRGSRLQGIRPILGALMVLTAAMSLQLNVAHAWPVNAQQCTTNIVLTAGQPLSFGSILGSAGGGTVTVSTASGIMAVGVTPMGGTVAAATFTGTDVGVNDPIDGCTTRAVTVLVGSAILTGPGTDMTVTAMTDSVTESGTPPLFWDYKTVPIYVGGTLNVNGNQATGSYSGTFMITVTYQ